MMPNVRMIKSILNDYGVGWAVNRVLYGAKLKTMKLVPCSEKWYEK